MTAISLCVPSYPYPCVAIKPRRSQWGPDPLLTPLGISQAARNTVAWTQEAKAGAPLPERLYSSPLSRAMSTLEITWEDLLLDEVRPVIKENLRCARSAFILRCPRKMLNPVC